MSAFPSLSEEPSVTGWEEGIAYDPTISTKFEAGYKQTRSRFTRVIEQWSVVYEVLPLADKNTLQTFERETVLVGSNSFTWTHPISGSSHTVRFSGPVKYVPNENDDYWNVSFSIEEV